MQERTYKTHLQTTNSFYTRHFFFEMGYKFTHSVENYEVLKTDGNLTFQKISHNMFARGRIHKDKFESLG